MKFTEEHKWLYDDSLRHFEGLEIEDVSVIGFLSEKKTEERGSVIQELDLGYK
jgi:hypothetical protein